MTPAEVFEKVRPSLDRLRLSAADAPSSVVLVTADGGTATVSIIGDEQLAVLAASSPELAALPEHVAHLRESDRCVVACVVIVPGSFTVASLDVPPN